MELSGLLYRANEINKYLHSMDGSDDPTIVILTGGSEVARA